MKDAAVNKLCLQLESHHLSVHLISKILPIKKCAL